MNPSSYNQPQQNPAAGVPNQVPSGAYAQPQGAPDAAAGTPPPAAQFPQTPYPAQAQAQPQQYAAYSATNGAAAPQTPSPMQGMAPAGSSVPQPGTGAGPGAHPVHANPNSTQNTLLIAEIRDGIVIMNDGSFRSVVMVKSVNFDLMSPQEQEAVEYSYQGFLNSLYFPIQIFIRSRKVDLQPYIERLDKIRSEHDNMLLAMLMDDYINYIDQLSQQTNIMDKKFYVVIPYFPQVDVQKAFTQSKNFLTGFMGLFDKKEQHVVINEADLEKAKTELRNRVQSVLQGLLQAGVQGIPLDTQELIELYYDTYNPDTATRQQLKDFNSLSADIITKGTGAAPQQHLQRELS